MDHGDEADGLLRLIIGVKLCVLSAYSTPLPFFDQWHAEGSELVQRSLHGTLEWRHLFEPHNRHRIFWTRLLVLGLFRINGQWDTQVEMIVAAGLHALCAVVLGAILIRRLGRAEEDKILWCLAFLFLLPFGWENTLSGGFQSQYYFLILFSVVAIWGLASHQPWSVPWWVGMAAGMLAWFSVASGWFAGVAVAVWTAFRWWRERNGVRNHAVTFAAAALLILGGVALLLGTNEADSGFQAKSAGEFLWKLCGLLGWPNQTPWAVAVAYAPSGWTLWRGLRKGRSRPTHAEGFVLPLAGWVLLQTAALAYSRNHYRGLDVSRYMDVQSLGTLVNFACLLTLARETRTAGADAPARRGLRIMQVVWVVVTISGLYRLTERDLRVELPFMAANNAREERNVAAFMTTPDPQTIAGKTWMDLQCSPWQFVSDLLMDPAVRAVMPPQVRPPLPLLPAHATGMVHRMQGEEASRLGVDGQGWLVASPPAEQAPSVFRSQTMETGLPRLQFRGYGAVGAGEQVGLVGERTGQVTPLLPDAETSVIWTETVQTPAEPFHLLARVEPGSRSVLAFFEPQATGRLTVWVDPLFRSATGWLFAGAVLWMGAAAYRRRAPEPVLSENPVPVEIPPQPPVGPALSFPTAREPQRAVRV